MFNTDLNYNINTAGSPAGYTFTSVITGTQVFPTAIVEGTLLGDFKQGAGSNASCSFFCAWNDAANLASYLLYCNTQTIAGVYAISFGAAHPLYNRCFCNEVKIAPVGDNVPKTTSGYQTKYSFARLDCTYAPYAFDPSSPTVIREESLEISGQVISIPSQTITVSGTATTNPQSIYYPLMRYSITIFGLSTLPLAAIKTCMNTVNSTNLTIELGGSITDTATAEFALYEGISQTKRTITTQGTSKWDITHTWLISPINFNFVLNPDAISGTVKITTPYGTAPDVFVRPDQVIYQKTDHAGILKV
jgi:hypothetical protein